jgi:hypothetical protein
MIGRTNKLPFNPIIWPAVPHDFTGVNNLGYYTTETTQRYVWGTRGMTWDGKVFRYGRSKDTLYAGYGAVNGASIDVSDLLNTNHTLTIAAGDREVLFTVTSTEAYDEGGITEDELVGAMYVVGHGAAATTECRTVIGNTSIAAATTGTIMIEVDYPFALAHTTGFNELPLNPYGYLGRGDSPIASVMGVPNITATTGQMLWIQTWGLCWCVPGGSDATPGDAALDRTVVFVGDGTVNGVGAITLEDGYQVAGFITDSTESGTGTMPMVMLQISI